MGLRVEMGVGRKTAQSVRPHHGLAVLLIALPLCGNFVSAQSGHATVRHHKAQEDPTTAKLTQAEAAIEKQDYAAAEPLLKEVVSAHPEDNAAWYDLGFVYHALNRSDEAVEAYKKSVQAKPNVFESNLNLGLELARSGNLEAEQYLRAATKLTPSSNVAQGHERAWLALGHLLESTNPTEAINAFRQAAVANPKDAEPHLLAGALLERQKAADAEQEYQLALAVNPQSSDAMAALTNLYMTQHRFPEAESLLRKLLVLRPNDANVHLQLGRMLAVSGKNADAIAEIEAGLKLDPSDAKAKRDLADLYAESKKYDQAQKIYNELLTTSPRDADLHYAVGRMLLRQKQFGGAQREFLQTAQLKPDDGNVYGDLAIAANENKNYPLAIKAIDMRAKYLPENPLTYFLRATAYDHLHDSKQASRYYHEFLNSSGGKFPEQEWQAKHRLIAIEPKK